MGNDGIVLSGKFSKALLDKNVKVWVAQGMQKLASEMPYYKDLAYHAPTDEELFSVMDGVERGELIEVPENGRYPEETDLPGFTTTYMVKNFGLIKSISKIAGRQDASRHKQKTEQKQAASLGRAYIRALNRSVHDVIRNGFDTAFTSYGDGKPFFSTQHTRIDGGPTTFRSNASSVGLTLNYENLRTAKRDMRNVVDHSGEVIDYSHKPLKLIVPVELEEDAYDAISFRGSQYAPDSADFAPNTHTIFKDVEVYVDPLLGEAAGGIPTAWYLKVKDLGDESPIKVYHRQGVMIETEKDFDTKKFKVSADGSWAIGWEDPVGKFWGSLGDNQPYAN